MWKLLKRRWKYFTARLAGRLEESADPKIQLEQAIGEAREQHRRLKDQAANVIANQKQTEIRLNRAISELERVNRNARQAIMMAEEAAQSGDEAKTASYTNAAEQLAGRLITLEEEIESLKSLLFQTSEAADQAKAAVSQNALSLQEKLSERQKLLGQLDQARMQEQMNEAMSTLSEAVGEDVPTWPRSGTRSRPATPRPRARPNWWRRAAPRVGCWRSRPQPAIRRPRLDSPRFGSNWASRHRHRRWIPQSTPAED